jgi:hypothetical protein
MGEFNNIEAHGKTTHTPSKVSGSPSSRMDQIDTNIDSREI